MCVFGKVEKMCKNVKRIPRHFFFSLCPLSILGSRLVSILGTIRGEHRNLGSNHYHRGAVLSWFKLDYLNCKKNWKKMCKKCDVFGKIFIFVIFAPFVFFCALSQNCAFFWHTFCTFFCAFLFKAGPVHPPAGPGGCTMSIQPGRVLDGKNFRDFSSFGWKGGLGKK